MEKGFDLIQIYIFFSLHQSKISFVVCVNFSPDIRPDSSQRVYSFFNVKKGTVVKKECSYADLIFIFIFIIVGIQLRIFFNLAFLLHPSVTYEITGLGFGLYPLKLHILILLVFTFFCVQSSIAYRAFIFCSFGR